MSDSSRTDKKSISSFRPDTTEFLTTDDPEQNNRVIKLLGQEVRNNSKKLSDVSSTKRAVADLQVVVDHLNKVVITGNGERALAVRVGEAELRLQSLMEDLKETQARLEATSANVTGQHAAMMSNAPAPAPSALDRVKDAGVPVGVVVVIIWEILKLAGVIPHGTPGPS